MVNFCPNIVGTSRDLSKNRRFFQKTIHVDQNHHKAEIAYWVGKDFSYKGFVTEAVREIIRFGFQDLGLNKIYAAHFPHNLASKKIMQNCGMKLEATLKQEYFKNGKPLDVLKCSILKQEFLSLEFES